MASVLVTLAACVPGCGSSPTNEAAAGDQAPRHPLFEVARALQSTATSEYDPLGDLARVADDADVVGHGEVVDVRAGYAKAVAPGILDPTLLLVVAPTRLLKGRELLGGSGEILVIQHRPEAVRVEELSRAVRAGPRARVLFALRLRPGDLAAEPHVVDPGAGRRPGDPLFWPAHPSAVLGVVGETAFPLLTGEELGPANGVAAVGARVGLRIDRTATFDATGSPARRPVAGSAQAAGAPDRAGPSSGLAVRIAAV